MKILIDGHGVSTPGKRSPDGRFREYLFNREIVRRIRHCLTLIGYEVRILVHEDTDIPLQERCRRANAIAAEAAKTGEKTILISIHVNAAGRGDRWLDARGWSVYTYYGQRLRADYADGDPDLEAPFYLLKNTYCPAVLTENLFMDNRDDVAFLTSEEGKKAIVALHVEGIMEYIRNWAKG